MLTWCCPWAVNLASNILGSEKAGWLIVAALNFDCPCRIKYNTCKQPSRHLIDTGAVGTGDAWIAMPKHINHSRYLSFGFRSK